MANFRHFLENNFEYSELMYFTPDIILSFFIVGQDICFDRNVLLISTFWDFMNKIVYILLQEIDEFWGRALQEV